eukprot:gene24768-biopygen4441
MAVWHCEHGRMAVCDKKIQTRARARAGPPRSRARRARARASATRARPAPSPRTASAPAAPRSRPRCAVVRPSVWRKDAARSRSTSGPRPFLQNVSCGPRSVRVRFRVPLNPWHSLGGPGETALPASGPRPLSFLPGSSVCSSGSARPDHIGSAGATAATNSEDGWRWCREIDNMSQTRTGSHGKSTFYCCQ